MSANLLLEVTVNNSDRSKLVKLWPSPWPIPAPPSFIVSDKYDAIDGGAKGKCGYLCLAMALGLERGEDGESFRTL